MKTTMWLSNGRIAQRLEDDALDHDAGDEGNGDRWQKMRPNTEAPHCINCQAMKVENIAISPCAKLRLSMAW